MTNLMPHPGKGCLFALLSLADLALTWWLLGHSGGEVYEANPVARWCLAKHGWAGLACFKAFVVLLVVGLAAVIARSRPRAAGRLLGLGCAGLAVVVGYSAALCRAGGLSPERRQAEEARAVETGLAELNRDTLQQIRRVQASSAFRERLCEDLVAGRRPLGEAAERMAASVSGREPIWLRLLAHRYPDLSTRARVAAWLIWHVVVTQRDDRRAAWRVARRLEREFRLTYGSPPPRDHRGMLRGAWGEGRYQPRGEPISFSRDAAAERGDSPRPALRSEDSASRLNSPG